MASPHSCAWQVSFLGELSPRSKDLLVSFGERLSCRLVAATLNLMKVCFCLLSVDTRTQMKPRSLLSILACAVWLIQIRMILFLFYPLVIVNFTKMCIGVQVPSKAFDSWDLGLQTTSEFGNAEVLPKCYPTLQSKLQVGHKRVRIIRSSYI